MTTLAAYFHEFDPIIVRLWGDFAVRWYGVSYLAGFVVGYLLLIVLSRRGWLQIPRERIADAMMWLIGGVIIGGRLGYLAVYDPTLFITFTTSPPFWGVLAINQGGMASHGGLVGVILAAWRISRGWKNPDGSISGRCSIWHVFDAMALGCVPGLLFGRLANFVNGELLGRVYSAAPVDGGKPGPWWTVQFPTEIIERADDLSNAQRAGVADLARRIAPELSMKESLHAIVAHDKKALLLALPRTEGSEGEFLSALLEYVRVSLVVFVVGEESPVVAESPDRARAMKAWAQTVGVERLQNWLEELIQARERIRNLPTHSRAILEATLLDLCREETTIGLDEIASRLMALEQRLASGVRAQPAVAGSTAPQSPNSGPSATAAVSVPTFRASTPSDGGPITTVPTSSRPTSTIEERGVLQPVPRASGFERVSPSKNEVARVEPAPLDATRAVASPTSSDRPRPLIGGTSDAWSRFLAVLAESSSTLADALRTRGKLADFANGRALVQLANLRDGERALVVDARNQKIAASAFSRAVGSTVQVVFEDQSAVRAHKDPYTKKIAEMFDGRIEDEG